MQKDYTYSEIVSDFVLTRRIEGSLHNEILGYASAAKSEVERLIQSLRPSANGLRSLLHLAEQIAHREKLTISEVLSDSDILAILDNAERAGSKETHKQLRECLERKRYPEATQVQEKLAALVKQIAHDTGLRISLPKDLEGDDLRVELVFDSVEGAEEVSKKFSSLSKHPALSQLFATLLGDLP